MTQPWEGSVLAKPSAGPCACKKKKRKDGDQDADADADADASADAGADGASCDGAEASAEQASDAGTANNANSANSANQESRVIIDDGKTPQFPGEGKERWINDPKLATDNDRRLLEWTRDNVPLHPQTKQDIDMFLEDMNKGTDRLWGPGESPALHPLPKDWTDPNGTIG